MLPRALESNLTSSEFGYGSTAGWLGAWRLEIFNSEQGLNGPPSFEVQILMNIFHQARVFFRSSQFCLIFGFCFCDQFVLFT